jgi:hypothetical protein
VDPFKRAFLCRNPSVKNERVADSNDGFGPEELKVIRRINADEPYTLLNCRKPITLAIKQFQTFTTVQSKDKQASVLQSLGFKSRVGGDGPDQAALDAHKLTEALRKMKLEAYVLHTPHNSIITVGGFDSLEDPNLRAMQNLLASRLGTREMQDLLFFPRPMPMKVPH